MSDEKRELSMLPPERPAERTAIPATQQLVLARTLEQATDAVVISNAQHRIIFINVAAAALWGMDRTDLVGQDVNLLMPPGAMGKSEADSEPEPGARREFPIRRRDGALRCGLLSTTTVEVAGSVYYAAFVKDITDEVQHGRERRQRFVCAADHTIMVTDASARRLLNRQSLERALRSAVSARQLELHYQPQIDLASGQMSGLEALARWQHSQLGQIPPNTFIPIAEESGLIIELGYWTVHEACRQLAAWRSEGLTIPNISVNLSPINFRDSKLSEIVAQCLCEHGLAGSDLTIEITEGVLFDDTIEASAAVTALHKLGVRLSIDDFGTGFSSLSRLIHLPVNEIKLDRSFLSDLHNSEAAQTLVETVIQIGRSLGLVVVAEGITSDAQRQLLKENGCSVGQGFHFSRPLAAPDVGEWLRSNSASQLAPNEDGLA